MSIPTEEQQIKGDVMGIGMCHGCRLEVAYAEIALGGVELELCRGCAKAIAEWLSADLKVGTRQRGGFEGDFGIYERTVRTNLQMLKLLGIEPKDWELASLMIYATEKA